MRFLQILPIAVSPPLLLHLDPFLGFHEHSPGHAEEAPLLGCAPFT